MSVQVAVVGDGLRPTFASFFFSLQSHPLVFLRQGHSLEPGTCQVG